MTHLEPQPWQQHGAPPPASATPKKRKDSNSEPADSRTAVSVGC
jgi:hypothetical protein